MNESSWSSSVRASSITRRAQLLERLDQDPERVVAALLHVPERHHDHLARLAVARLAHDPLEVVEGAVVGNYVERVADRPPVELVLGLLELAHARSGRPRQPLEQDRDGVAEAAAPRRELPERLDVVPDPAQVGEDRLEL